MTRSRRDRGAVVAAVALLWAAAAVPCAAQRSDENAVTSASDAFGTSIGSQSIGGLTRGWLDVPESGLHLTANGVNPLTV
jgi:hypothetical protein